MPDVSLVVHGHFYQPPRENPWTESVAEEPSASPFHDWNERITAECYRPNGWARIVDDRNRVLAVVDNYAHLSFNVGPTLLSWLEQHEPDVLRRMVEGDRIGRGAIAQAYNHMILPLATERDVRTQVRWGLADFRHRFGRDSEGIWLPETAVNDQVLRVLAEEGVRFTILAPNQALAVRPLHDNLLGAQEPWHDVSEGSIDGRRPYRWIDPEDPTRYVDLVFYDGAISHDLAFGLSNMTAEGFTHRVRQAAGEDGGLVTVATDGETFGHHHHYAERTLAYALPVIAPREGTTVTTIARHLNAHPPTWQVRIRESAWSCAHGVGRWKEDCGCSTGADPGANQRWRAPLRQALDILRDAGAEVLERRGGKVLHDPWAARDDYVDVVLGRRSIEDFAVQHVSGDLVEALTLMEQQRHALLMYTSCAWFFWDLAGLETVQCLRYAARAVDLLGELGEEAPLDAFFACLAEARSNQPHEGTGVDVWHRHVEPARVDAARAAAHVALAGLLQHQRPTDRVASWEVLADEHRDARRSAIAVEAGTITLRHVRTRRTTSHTYAVLLMGSLEVLGTIRDADPGRDDEDLRAVLGAVESGARLTEVLRIVGERLDTDKFGLRRALPDAAGQIVTDAAASVEARFTGAFDRLYEFNRNELSSLVRAGMTLPPAVRVPAELALAARLEREITAQHGSWDPGTYQAARRTAEEAEALGLTIDAPRAQRALEQTLLDAVTRAVAGDVDALEAGLALRQLATDLGVGIDLSRAQELVYDALLEGGREDLRPLAGALGLADRLGVPRPD
jgi:alpha-amylase/alpha-mannosidase (GH57 family)